MRDSAEHLDRYRVRGGDMASTPEDGFNGMFVVPHHKYKKTKFQIIASNGMGWEHVSVTYRGKGKIPTWYDMCYVKDLFWDEEETVMQLHPPKSQYVNNHPNVLHLWRPTDQKIPAPPIFMVGAITAEPA